MTNWNKNNRVKKPQIVTARSIASCLLPYLESEHIKEVCEGMQDRRMFNGQMIDGPSSNQDCKRILEELHSVQQEAFLGSINKNDLDNIVAQHVVFNAGYHRVVSVYQNLNNLFQCLSPKLCADVCRRVINQVQRDMHLNDLDMLFDNIDALKRRAVMDVLVETCIPRMVKSSEDFEKVSSKCDRSQLKSLYDALQVQLEHGLASFITNRDDIKRILYSLDVDQCMEILADNRVKAIFFSSFASIGTFYYTMWSLRRPTVVAICKLLKDQFRMLIENSHDFQRLLSLCGLSEFEKETFLEATQDWIQELVKDTGSLLEILSELPPSGRDYIYKTMQEKILTFIQTPKELRDVSSYLRKTQANELCENLKHRGFIVPSAENKASARPVESTCGCILL